MADQRKRLSELPTSTSIDGQYTLGVNEQNEGVKIPLGEIVKQIKQPAVDAQAAANNAVKTATEAKTAAQTATTKATEAKTAADDALSEASAAKTAADNAKKSASDAATAANDAKTASENAVSKAGQAIDIVAPRLFINAQYLLGLSGEHSLETVIGLLAANENAAMFKQSGVVITFIGEAGWESWQYVFQLRNGMMPPPPGTDMFLLAAYWRKFGGSATVGNCYNVTVDVPKAQGFYTLEEAIAQTYEKGYTNIGIQVTFSIANKSWKTYQYIGPDSSEVNFKNQAFWLDLAGMSAGAETLINVNYLCRDKDYTCLLYTSDAADD